MPKSSKIYWTDEFDQTIHQWLVTKDEETWNTVIYPVLVDMARWRMMKYPSWRLLGEDQSIINDLLNHVYRYLNYYDASKGKLRNYIIVMMKHRLYTLFNYLNREKRGLGKNISIDEMMEGNEERNIAPRDVAAPTKEYSRYDDPLFIQFYCNWWKKRIVQMKESSRKTRCIKLVIGIIEGSIELGGNAHYSPYIAEHARVTRQYVSFVLKHMRQYNDQIVIAYEGIDLKKLLMS